ncbi:MAG: DUF2934 domain-containing protein [Candidatus Thiodiazotropha sp.]
MVKKPEEESAKKVVKKKAASKKKAVAKKKVTSKKTVAKKRVSKKAATPKTTVSPRERYEMIATMAFYRAESRNFEPGYDVDDWLECEKFIDDMLSKG